MCYSFIIAAVNVQSAALVEGGKWVHLAVTYNYDAGAIVFYVDGEPAETASVSPGMGSTGDTEYLGGDCDCALADFQVHDVPLAPEQVMEIYARTDNLVPLVGSGQLFPSNEFIVQIMVL